MPAGQKITDGAKITTLQPLDEFDVSVESGGSYTTMSLLYSSLLTNLSSDLTIPTYYTSDGLLSSNRTVDMAGFYSHWEDGQIAIGDTTPTARLLVKSEIGEDAFRVTTFSVTESFVVNNVGNVGIGNAGDPIASGANDSKFRVTSANNGGTGMGLSVTGFNTGPSIGINMNVAGGSASSTCIGLKALATGGSRNSGVQGISNAGNAFNIGIEGNCSNATNTCWGGLFIAGAGAGIASSGGVIGVQAQVQGNPNTKKTAFKAIFGENTNNSVNTGLDVDLSLNGTNSQNIGLDINVTNGSAINAALYIRNGDIYFLNLANSAAANRVWNNGTDDILRIG